MKTIFSILIFIFFLGNLQSGAQGSNSYLLSIQKFHQKLNNDYANPTTSPLKQEDLASFKNLDIFPIDENFKIIASFEKTPNDPIFEMQTTTERKPPYKRFGIATFNLNGKIFKLNVYQNQQLLMDFEYRNYLFLPFTDATNGYESYKGGRYIDLEIPTAKSLVIDFNKAYNPYCAYNSKYSCPVVPKENHINIAIKAGVKAFNKH